MVNGSKALAELVQAVDPVVEKRLLGVAMVEHSSGSSPIADQIRAGRGRKWMSARCDISWFARVGDDQSLAEELMCALDTRCQHRWLSAVLLPQSVQR